MRRTIVCLPTLTQTTLFYLLPLGNIHSLYYPEPITGYCPNVYGSSHASQPPQKEIPLTLIHVGERRRKRPQAGRRYHNSPRLHWWGNRANSHPPYIPPVIQIYFYCLLLSSIFILYFVYSLLCFTISVFLPPSVFRSWMMTHASFWIPPHRGGWAFGCAATDDTFS